MEPIIQIIKLLVFNFRISETPSIHHFFSYSTCIQIQYNCLFTFLVIIQTELHKQNKYHVIQQCIVSKKAKWQET